MIGMMGRALLVVGWLATLGLVSTGVLGYFLSQSPDLMTPHILLGLLTSLLILFSHSWIMFYLIGTGRAIKDAVLENELEQELVEKTKYFKNKSNPWILLAVTLVITTFVLGAGVYTRAVPGWVHHSLFYITAAVQIWTMLVEGRVLGANEKLMIDVDRRIAA